MNNKNRKNMSDNNYEKISDIEEEIESEYSPDKEYILKTKSKRLIASGNEINCKLQNPDYIFSNPNERLIDNNLIKINELNNEKIIKATNNLENLNKDIKFDNNIPYIKDSHNRIKKDVKKDRLLCLDIFRGITLFYMVVVNSNLNDQIYWFFTETDWNGLTPADCIFPSFLFIMGIAIVLSTPHNSHNKLSKFRHISKRSLTLFLLGLFFNLQKINFYHFEKLRIMGVLQRLGITYFLASLLHLLFDEFYFFKRISNPVNQNLNNKNNEYLYKIKEANRSGTSHSSVTSKTSKKYFLFINYGLALQIFVVFIFLLAYTLFAYCYDVPGCGKGRIEKICFAGSYIDRQIFGNNHIWVQYEYDPEGIISTLTAVYPVFIGYFCGKVLRFIKNKKKEIVEVQEYLTKENFSEKYFNPNSNGKSKYENVNKYIENEVIEESKELPNREDVRYISNENESKFDRNNNNFKNNNPDCTGNDYNNHRKSNEHSNEFQPKMKVLIDQQSNLELNFEKEMRKMDFKLLYLWFTVSALNLTIGLLFNNLLDMPYNKKAYTLSFAFLVCGVSSSFLCLFYVILDLIKYKKFKSFCDYFFAPFKWMGMNSLLVFCGSTFYYIILDCNIKFHVEGYSEEKISLYRYFFDNVFMKIANHNEPLAEMFLSLFAGFIFLFIAYAFYRRNWFIKL